MFSSEGNLTFLVLCTNIVNLNHTDESIELADITGATLHFRRHVSRIFSQAIAFMYVVRIVTFLPVY